ncbi:MAG TPA: GTP-binding protein [Rhodopila sp.]|nr:GTP-binding protein [Rhodopila sp.]
MTRPPIAPGDRPPPFLTQGADRARMPVALLSGFLGSGKTTLVNALLRDPRLSGTAVAVNEFGDVPLDRDLIDHGQDRTVVLANGCLCCNLSGDMEDAVMRLFSRREAGEVPRFKRLIIEPSGLSDPAPIAQAILRNPVMARGLRLSSIIATVDAQFGEQQLARHPETRKQVALADHLVLTKTDVAPAGPLPSLLADLNPGADILEARFGAVDAARVFPADFLDPAAPPTRRSILLADDGGVGGHLSDHATITLTADRPLRWRPFDDWLRRIRLPHAQALLRLKGMLDIDGATGPVVIHGIHHVLNAPVQLDAWPTADHRSRLVLIADRATITAAQESWEASLPGILAA